MVTVKKKRIRPKRKKRKLNRWKNENYIEIFLLAKDGLSDRQISKALGIERPTFQYWKKKDKALRNALERGRGFKRQGEMTLQDYVYGRLSEPMRNLWDKITECDTEENGVRRIEALLKANGKRARQCLFIHAYLSSSFNASEACRRVNIPYGKFKQWVLSDPDFHQLMDEMLEHKKNFYESALVKLVKKGESAAIIFANRTINRSRGYGDKVEVNHTGQIDHRMLVVSIDELKLPLEIRQTFLQAVREKKERDKRQPQALPSY